MLDDRVRAVLKRLEAEDADERARGVSRELRSRQVARTTGQFLFDLVAPQTDCEVLEIGGSRAYSTIWLAAGLRYFGGRVLSLEFDPLKAEAWRANIAEAGLEETAELIEGDAFETLSGIDDVFDIVFIDAEKDDYERLFELARPQGRAGRALRRRQRALPRGDAGRLLAGPAGRSDARVGHRSARPRARAQRRAAPAGHSPDGGLTDLLPLRYISATAERRWSGSEIFKYGQWRYQRVGACPRDL